MEEMQAQETSGVEEQVPAAGEQVEEQTEQQTTETGVEEQQAAAAGGEDATEKAFAKRLAAEKEKLEKQYSPYKDFIETEAAKYNMTTDQYLKAVEQQQKEQQRQELLDQGIDPDMLYSALDKHPVMQQAKQVLFEKQMANFKDKPFFNELQPQVSQMLQNTPGMDVNTAYSFLLGQTLLNGGMEKLTAQYQERISQLEKGIQVQGKNAENAGNSTGSVTGQGEVGNDFISQESFERNKNDRSWVVKNLTNIQTSRKKW